MTLDVFVHISISLNTVEVPVPEWAKPVPDFDKFWICPDTWIILYDSNKTNGRNKTIL